MGDRPHPRCRPRPYSFEALAARMGVSPYTAGLRLRIKGTTLAAATGLSRAATGIDLDPRNAHLAQERVGMFLDVDLIDGTTPTSEPEDDGQLTIHDYLEEALRG